MKSGKSVLGIFIRSVILLTLVLSTCLQSYPPAAQAGYDAAYGWVYNHNLGINTNNPAYFDVELDSLGHPHLAYYDDITNNLIYRYFDGTQWQTGLTQWGTYNYVSLELDSGDLPHIAFYSTISTMAGYAHYNGSTWQTLPITPGQTSAGQFVTLALTDGGVPVAAFNYSGLTNLSIATLVEGAFVISTVENVLTSGDYYSHISLQLDQNDHPHLAYCMGSAVGSCDELRYAAFDGKDWAAEPLDRDPGAGYYASLALDSSDYPHISYHIDNTSLNYIYQDAGGWHRSETVAAGDTGLYSSLALDSAGLPGIAFYQQQAPSLLRYLYWNGTSWAANMSPELSNSGTYLNLVLDSAGNPYLAYWDTTYVDIALATYQPLPDLAVTQTWVDTVDDRLLAVVQNVGKGTYSADLEVELYVNDVYINNWGGSPTLLPGEQLIVELPVPACTAASIQVGVELVIYDSETNDANNFLNETWICDTQPVNISSFTISSITPTGFNADWTTNKPAKTKLTYQTSNGRFPEIYTDDVLNTSHHVQISGLEPHTVYYVRAISEDPGGIIGTSKTKTVKTAPLAGTLPGSPVVKFERANTRLEIYQFSASYLDTSNIQRVEFLMDGELIGTDFTAQDGQFEVQLSPGEEGFTRNAFYSQHDVVTQAITYAEQTSAVTHVFAPVRENLPIESNIITPALDNVLYIAGTTVPAGTKQKIEVFAQQFEWECEWAEGGVPISCGDVAGPVSSVRFYNDALLLGTNSVPTNGVYSVDWDISGKSPGNYPIQTLVLPTDTGSQENSVVLHIVQGQPDLSFERTVTRQGSFFKVDVVLRNSPSATLPAVITSFRDSHKGFQPVKQAFANWVVSPSTILQGTQGTANITFNSTLTLPPNTSYSFYYYVVPVLFPNMTTAVYRMGIPNSKIEYTIGGTPKSKTATAETAMVNDTAAPGGISNLLAANSRAMASADYLLITTPAALTDHYVMSEVHDLMGDMARLASLKQGVLAYWDQDLDKDVLNGLLQDNSSWANRLHPNFEKRGKGYVLLVGESEILPAYTTGPFTLNWSDEDGSDDYDVAYSDNPYAHTDGNGAPDLLLGRIIGNTAAQLSKAIQNSIDTHVSDSYERSQAYLASGVGIGEEEMQYSADRAAITLEADGYTVSKHHWEEEAFLASFTGIAFAQHEGLTHADLDGDGTEELVWARDDSNQVNFINGTTGAGAFAFNLDFEDGDSLTAGDVDNDGVPEIVIGDRNDTIRTLELNGAVSASFHRDFSAWEKVEAGNVDTASAGDEIVMADDNDRIFVYTSTGTQRANINLSVLGFDFADYDILRVGQILPDAPEEIIFTDRTHDKIVVMSAGGAVLHTIDVDFDYGDNLEIANVTGDSMNEIIIADRDNHIRAYTLSGGNNAALTTYIDVEQYDGLVTRDVAGTEIDDIFHFDRANRIRRVDINYPANALQLFRNNVTGADLIWFFGHGNTNYWGPALNNATFPVDFSGAHPIVNAWTCLSGNYEGNSDNGIAEAYLQSGAGVYIGATEVSPNPNNSNTSRKLYRDYWEPEGDHKIAESFLRFKNDRWEVSDYYDWWWYFVNEYNFYGDPKFDITAPTITGLDYAPDTAAAQPLAATQNLSIDLPMYEVETIAGVDYLVIPPDAGLGTHSGDLYLDQDAFQVPLYIYTQQIPAGTQVQDVILTGRSDLTSTIGLNLPITEMIESAATQPLLRSGLNQQTISALPGHDWSPNFEAPFTWSVYDNVDGGSTLTLTLHPFYYDPAALYSEYYQHFEFAIQTETTSVQIFEAALDQPVISSGGTVHLSVQVANSAVDPLDAVVSTFIRKGGSGEVVDGFELAAIDDLSGTGSLELTWDWTDPTILPGSYTIEVVIEDMMNNRLAQRSLDLTLGQASGEVTEFTASPVLFQAGQTVAATLKFANTGSLPLSGQVVIQVQTLEGEIVDEFTQPFSALNSAALVTAQMNWNSTAAPDSAYRLVGYVNYASQSTQAVTRTIGILATVYLPLLRR